MIKTRKVLALGMLLGMTLIGTNGVSQASVTVMPTQLTQAGMTGEALIKLASQKGVTLSPAMATAAAGAAYLVKTGASPSLVTCGLVPTIRSRANGDFVAAEFGSAVGSEFYGMLRARSTSPGIWESFDECRDPVSGRTILYSNAIGTPWYDRAVSAELGYPGIYYGMLRARATAVGPWETFYTPRGPCSGFCNTTFYSSANQRFVSAELGYTGAYYGMLRARATTVGLWEEFYW